MMPLTMVNAGEPSVIKKVGGKEETRRFLLWRNLDLCQAELLTVVFGNRRKPDRERERFQSCHWQRYGQQDYGLMKKDVISGKIRKQKG